MIIAIDEGRLKLVKTKEYYDSMWKDETEKWEIFFDSPTEHDYHLFVDKFATCYWTSDLENSLKIGHIRPCCMEFISNLVKSALLVME